MRLQASLDRGDVPLMGGVALLHRLGQDSVGTNRRLVRGKFRNLGTDAFARANSASAAQRS